MNNSDSDLLLVNSETPLYAIQEILSKTKRNCIIISTHRYSPKKLGILARSSISELVYATVSDLLDESEFSEIDKISTSIYKLRDKECLGKVQTLFRAISYFKTRLAVLKIKRAYNTASIYTSTGLGLEPQAVYDAFDGPIFLIDTNKVNRRKLPPRKRFNNMFIGLLRKTHHFVSANITVVRYKDNHYFFKSSSFRRLIKFLHVSPDVSIVLTRKWRPDYIIRRFIGLAGFKKCFACATIHDSSPPFNENAAIIVQDGYLPSNYSETYLTSYSEYSKLCPVDIFAAQWFEAHNKKQVHIPIFRRPCIPDIMASGYLTTRSILIVLNHSGDWSALINRSDSFDLLQCVIEAAQKLPQITFIIRPHPTMIHAEHEGKRSHDNLREYVNDACLNNVAISNSSLANALCEAQLVLSEYSDVLFEGLQEGKPIIIYKPPYRRSFMQDLIDLGFPSFETSSELYELLSQKHEFSIQKNISAVKAYNAASAQWNAER